MKMKKIVVGLLSTCMIVSLGTTALVGTAFATPVTKPVGAELEVTCNVSSTGEDLEKKIFDLYKVFDVIVHEKTGASEQVLTYSVNGEFETFFTDVAKISAGDTFDHDAMEYVKEFETRGEMQLLVEKLRTYALTNNVPIAASTKPTVSIVGTDADKTATVSTDTDCKLCGYYLVLDAATNVNGTGELVTAGALVTIPEHNDKGMLSANARITLKGSLPNIKKEVKHNDTGNWEIISDHQIGDTVEYRIIADLPVNVQGYDDAKYGENGISDPETVFDYIYEITDVPSKGVDINRKSVTIYLDEAKKQPVEGALHYKENIDGGPEDGGFKLIFDMVAIRKNLQPVHRVYIYYDAVLTKDAVVTVDAERNQATLEYSNNPYDHTSTNTIGNSVYTYTFDLDVTKTAGDKVTPLQGAKFALYQTNVGGKDNNTQQIYLSKKEDNVFYVNQEKKAQASDDLTSAAGPAGIITTDDTGKFTIIGLDDRISYELREIKAPDKYNEADPLFFVIEATYTDDKVKPVLKTLITDNNTAISHKGNDLATTIVNTSTELLPETGGIGTTYFIYGGIALMIGAVVLFVVKRKKP